ncbi:multiple coagulation factor deficiency protein 2-like [Acanthaster planci]|uniref:Multiple coagulation factor deficiency protein 2-like n=1 Tax=Acanthaster planci TaxID=133434 RepID=A0A8B7YPX2_ACAPL|nr:multiple coagulation factor deficiency protein 2-like [Acanthaster planci]
MKANILSVVFLGLHVSIIVHGQGTPNQAGQQQHQQAVPVQAGQSQGSQVHMGQPSGQPNPQVHQMNQGGNPNIIKVHTQDKGHIMEHLDGVIDKPESEMTKEELQLHYFKLHDYDSNNMLDGTELIQAITHYQDSDRSSKVMGEEELMSLLDPILQNEDRNRDGYIDYPEYAKSQRTA